MAIIPFLKSRKRDDASPPPAEGKSRVIPSLGALTQVRRVHEGALEDHSGERYVVWKIAGFDCGSPQVINGWSLLLNSIDYPVQVLIRQHAPDLSDVRRKLIDARPEHMRSGRIGNVGNSLVDYLTDMEDQGGIVGRSWHLVVRESKAMELAALLSQSGFDKGGSRLGDRELGLLLQACLSGMGYGHTQDFYQVQEHNNYLELNHRYTSVYEVTRWPRRVSLLFLEQMLRGGDEMDISMWLWPTSPRESQSRLQTQRSRFEGSRMVSLQKGKLVPHEVELAIRDVTRISENVERGTSKLFRRTMTIAVYGRTQDELKEVGEKLSSHFRAALARVSRLRLRQGRGFAAMMPLLRGGLSEPDLTDSDTLLRMFPFGPMDLNEHDGTLLGMDLRSRTPVIYNPFNPRAMNGHLFVMARSGAGKSFFTKVRVVREAALDIPVYLIDPDGEYGLNPFLIGFTD